jgi:transcriptional regulator with XRE-family HTH domain
MLALATVPRLSKIAIPIMHIRMNLSSASKQRFLVDLRAAMRRNGWSQTELAEKCQLNQGQVSRICAGQFKNFSSNVMRICIMIGLEPEGYVADRPLVDDKARISETAIQIWDGTRDDAERVIALLRDILALRRSKR